MRNLFKLENWIDRGPYWLKAFYVKTIKTLKKIAGWVGVLQYLDKRSTNSQTHHYLRSLFAIHQLEDMIHLDVPWWTYDAIDYINQYLQLSDKKLRVFEYGSGASTIWLAKRSHQVTSIEHDAHWYDRLEIHTQQKQNINLLLKTPEPILSNHTKIFSSIKAPKQNFIQYVESIKAFDSKFDIIIIDGRCRTDCFTEALKNLNPDGILVFDNSNRKRYQSALQRSDLTIKRFYGRVPGSPFSSETAIIKLNSPAD